MRLARVQRTTLLRDADGNDRQKSHIPHDVLAQAHVCVYSIFCVVEATRTRTS